MDDDDDDDYDDDVNEDGAAAAAKTAASKVLVLDATTVSGSNSTFDWTRRVTRSIGWTDTIVILFISIDCCWLALRQGIVSLLHRLFTIAGAQGLAFGAYYSAF
jgi:hypothetical protein